MNQSFLTWNPGNTKKNKKNVSVGWEPFSVGWEPFSVGLYRFPWDHDPVENGTIPWKTVPSRGKRYLGNFKHEKTAPAQKIKIQKVKFQKIEFCHSKLETHVFETTIVR